MEAVGKIGFQLSTDNGWFAGAFFRRTECQTERGDEFPKRQGCAVKGLS
jgi:hypothetical protein